MKPVSLADRFITFDEFTEEMDEAISMFEVNTKVLDYDLKSVRLGNQFEMEVITLTSEERNKKIVTYYHNYEDLPNLKESHIVRINFDPKTNKAKTVEVYSRDTMINTYDFHEAAEAIKQVAILFVQINTKKEISKEDKVECQSDL